MISDEELVAAVASGDSKALEALYDRYSRIVFALALRMLSHGDIAEDVVQETFWRVWRRANTFQASSGTFSPWLFGIARNLCIDELRRRQVRPGASSGSNDELILQAIPDNAQDVEHMTWQVERRRLIIEALNELPVDQREVIEMAYFGGLSQREIAEKLNDPLGTVKTRVRLGLQKLRQFLHIQGIGQDDR
ncbi:sigma-70 family RNA polymerase sigma factor [Candidatus Gracilibacteria bacterium]|nr:sigma-70 family RNA polymerase sigma factor [Candidatus Gracilibacteria bacterium]